LSEFRIWAVVDNPSFGSVGIPTTDDLLGRVGPVGLKHVLGDIQTDVTGRNKIGATGDFPDYHTTQLAFSNLPSSVLSLRRASTGPGRCPIVRRGASLHADEARRQRFEE
jgi:hypothetical protein